MCVFLALPVELLHDDHKDVDFHHSSTFDQLLPLYPFDFQGSSFIRRRSLWRFLDMKTQKYSLINLEFLSFLIKINVKRGGSVKQMFANFLSGKIVALNLIV